MWKSISVLFTGGLNDWQKTRGKYFQKGGNTKIYWLTGTSKFLLNYIIWHYIKRIALRNYTQNDFLCWEAK